jgi:hypothetical protein
MPNCVVPGAVHERTDARFSLPSPNPFAVCRRLSCLVDSTVSNGQAIVLPRKDWFNRGDALKVKDLWHLLAGRDLIFAGMNGRQRVRVLLNWMGRGQSVVLEKNLLVAA